MRKAVVILGIYFSFSPPGISAGDDLDTISRRIVESIIPRDEKSRRNLEKQAFFFLSTLDGEGKWKDIDYLDQGRANWKTAAHMRRVFSMAKAWKCLPGGKKKRKLLLGIRKALDFWFRNDFSNPNWWWNQIGIPKRLGLTFLLIRREAKKEEKQKAIKVLKRAVWKAWTGENLAWGVTIQVYRGILENSTETAKEAFDRFYREIRVFPPDKEGIMPDMSFHQHGRVLYSGGYGAGFSIDVASFLFFTKGTGFEFPEEKKELLLKYLLEGQRWMIWKDIFDYGTIGRGISRRNRNARSQIRGLELLLKANPGRRSEIEDFMRHIQGKKEKNPLVGNKHFWCSDFMVHRRPGFMGSAGMFSTRVDNTDSPCNSEGRKSHHIADGANFFYLDGNEYKDIFPVWDWKKVPGTTVEQDPRPLSAINVRTRGRTRFVGGVSDGKYGMALMHLKRGKLEAYKAWAFLDNGWIAFGNLVSSSGRFPVSTAVNQCVLRGKVFSGERPGPVPKGTHTFTGRTWILHDNVGYLFPVKERILLRNGDQSGSWASIGVGPKEEITVPVFKLWIDHGKRIDNPEYIYLVFPYADRKFLENALRSPPYRVISNDRNLMAARAGAILFAAFMRPGSLEADPWKLSANEPCLVLARKSGNKVILAAANPLCEPLRLRIGLAIPIKYTETRNGISYVNMNLPGGNFAGSSVVKKLEIGSDGELPDSEEFRKLVLEIIRTYPTDGTHKYFWPKGKAVAGWAGNTMDLYYKGRLFSRAEPRGRCYCCGLTFEIFFRAWKKWCQRKGIPFDIAGLGFKDLKRFRAHWFGSNNDLRCVGGAIPEWNLGFSVPYDKVKPGDFVQFWRYSGSGHSVIFLSWIKDKRGKTIKMKYFSTQGSTNGIGINSEPIGKPGGINLSRFYAARVGK